MLPTGQIISRWARKVGIVVVACAHLVPAMAQQRITSSALHAITAPTDSSAPVAPATISAQPLAEAAAATPDSSALNQAPSFPGGEASLLRFIRERLRYPALAARNRIEGKVVVSFWLDERGRPYGFGILKGLGAGLDEEALRILREMPDWTPAVVNGRPVLLQLRIPVSFRLAQ
jgi:periplasmic protein TonB